jgi:hypothetical protein
MNIRMVAVHRTQAGGASVAGIITAELAVDSAGEDIGR